VGALVGVSVGAVVVFGVAVMIQAALVGVMVGEAGALNSRLAEKLHAISANTLLKITIMNCLIGHTPCDSYDFFLIRMTHDTDGAVPVLQPRSASVGEAWRWRLVVRSCTPAHRPRYDL
jgi:hypothetical protein